MYKFVLLLLLLLLSLGQLMMIAGLLNRWSRVAAFDSPTDRQTDRQTDRPTDCENMSQFSR